MIKKIESKNFDIKDSHILEVARKNGRYSSLKKLFSMSSEDVLEAVDKSGLRGKGGGGAQTGGKWKLIPNPSEKPTYLIVNADESEPGTFKDRQILEFDPHLLIEGIICSSYAIKSHHAYIYIRGEYVFWAKRLQRAIDEAYEAKILGESVDGYDYKLDITLHRGAGAYICGEKSALVESLEGKRGHPRLKPQQKEPEWFFGCPSVVNNVETIASVPFIVKDGFEAYRAFGTQKSPGTMLFGMSGHVQKPGIYEIQFGESMSEFINRVGEGVKDGKKLKAIIPGGSSTHVLRADEIEDITLDYESLRAHGSSLGTGGMILMDESVFMPDVVKNLFEFYHHESCGQCTPCREGVGWSDKLMGKILDGNGTKKDLQTLMDLSFILNGKTICVFAPSVAYIIDSYIGKFKDEFYSLVK